MLSYRKSQQVSLTEKLKKKNVIHVFGVSGSGTTMARFCLSAFVRVATLVVFAREPMIDLCHSAFVRVATQLFICKGCKLEPLPQRIRAGCDFSSLQNRISLSTLPQRIRAGCDPAIRLVLSALTPLPQRIRAGCDCLELHVRRMDDLFHSAFVRVATKNTKVATPQNDLCHSAFVRVATYTVQIKQYMSVFATAHSCGLRRRQQTSPNPTLRFATAHSCGLRLYYQ